MEDQKSAQERANEALSEIGTKAFDETGGDRWRAGQPLLTDPGAPPAAPVAEEVAPVASAETPTADEKPTSESDQKFFGKYKTIEEAERGYFEAVRMGNEAKARADAVEARLPKPEAPKESDPIEELEALGLPRDPIERAIRKMATQTVQEMFAPAVGRIQADQEIVARYPAYREKFDEVTKFLDANPEVKQGVLNAEAAGQFKLAREYAWLNFAQANAAASEQVLQEQASARVEETKRTRKDAAVLTPSRSEARTKPAEESMTEADFNRLKGLAKAGHPAPLWRATIGKTLGKELDQLLQQGG